MIKCEHDADRRSYGQRHSAPQNVCPVITMRWTNSSQSRPLMRPIGIPRPAELLDRVSRNVDNGTKCAQRPQSSRDHCMQDYAGQVRAVLQSLPFASLSWSKYPMGLLLIRLKARGSYILSYSPSLQMQNVRSCMLPWAWNELHEIAGMLQPHTLLSTGRNVI